jgi:hypothetical protein
VIFNKLCGIPVTSSVIAESTSALIAKNEDRFSLCRAYERMVNNDDLNTQDIKTLQLKYPEASRKCIRRWRRGVKPTGWKMYVVLVDPDLCHENINLMMVRHGVSEFTARKAADSHWASRPYDVVEKELEEDNGWPSPRRPPSHLSPLLAGWLR